MRWLRLTTSEFTSIRVLGLFGNTDLIMRVFAGIAERRHCIFRPQCDCIWSLRGEDLYIPAEGEG